MYIISALIVERTSAMPYTAFVQSYIFNPLNLSSTSYNATHALLTGRLSEGHSLPAKETAIFPAAGCSNRTHRPIPFFLSELSHELIAGPGGVLSSAKDIASLQSLSIKIKLLNT